MLSAMGRSGLVLVSCVGNKRRDICEARDLYTSDWFVKARQYVESRGAEWFILSAKYGLLSPTTLIEPYEQTLNKMPIAQRKEWARHVVAGLRAHLGDRRRVEILAGQRYREFVVPALEEMGVEVSVPMEGLKIGEQLSWLGMQGTREGHLRRFYDCLAELEERTGGKRRLGDGRGPIPRTARGVYFFFEPGEARSDSGSGSRVVRVGTHGLTANTKSTLWSRLAQHRGKAKAPGGNHRGSIFRLLVGDSLIRRDGLEFPSWGVKQSAPKDVRALECELEARVSRRLAELPYLWLQIDDEPGPGSLRGVVERNSIALLSNWEKDALDGPTAQWLGHSCSRERVRGSGLWNQNHVDEKYDPGFLGSLEELAGRA